MILANLLKYYTKIYSDKLDDDNILRYSESKILFSDIDILMIAGIVFLFFHIPERFKEYQNIFSKILDDYYYKDQVVLSPLIGFKFQTDFFEISLVIYGK